MIDLLLRWPPWYWLLIAFALYLAVSSVRFALRVAPAYAKAKADAATPRERGYVAGSYAVVATAPVAWTLGFVGLVTGWQPLRLFFAGALLLSAWKGFRPYATGVAEGRKAAALAASQEYVAGRAAPTSFDFALAVAYMTITRLLPFVGTIYAEMTLR